MLSFFDNDASLSCDGYNRRDFLRIGSLGLAGLSLPALLAARASASGADFVKDKSVVFLFLRGGPTQHETFDPKMTAPEGIRAMYGETKTKLPGITFGHHFEQLAALADKLSIVRSFKVGTGNHGAGRQLVLAGGNPTKAPMGAVYGRLAGSTNSAKGMPNNVVLTPRAIGPEYAHLQHSVQEAQFTGNLSAEFKAFDPGSGNSQSSASNKKKKRKQPTPKSGGLLADMQLKLTQQQLDDRRALLKQIDSLRHGLDDGATIEGYDKFQQQAFDVIMRGVSKAFDLSKEDPATIARYDTKEFVIPASVLKKKRKNNTPKFHPIALGKQMLLARRLVEAGCGFVTVTSDGWDMHGNAFGIDDGMACLGPAVDRSVSAFLQDLEARGLSDKVLLVVTGEMGRTPKINKKKGRDHWARLCPLMLAGGGLKMGQVVGQSDKQGGAPATTPVTLNNLLATVMHTMFDMGTLRVAQGLPTDLVRLVNSVEPIHELM